MQIDTEFIITWQTRYDEIARDEKEYQSILRAVRQEIENNQSIQKETFEKIIRWKSARVMGHIAWNAFSKYETGIRAVLPLKCQNKMAILDRLPGIGPAVAATILHFIFPDKFPIYDFRTVEVLHEAKYLDSSIVSAKRYPKFQKAITKIKEDLSIYNLRQIDRALFAYHKIQISGKREGHIKKKNASAKVSLERITGTKKEGNMPEETIPERVKRICERLGANGKEIERKDILKEAEKEGINPDSVLPADWCDNTVTGQHAPNYNFLHMVRRGMYILSEYK